MTLPIPLTLIRENFAQTVANGGTVDAVSADLDAQIADIVTAANIVKARLELISTADGSIRTLTSSTRFAATASQTAFTVPAYDTTSDSVAAWASGVRIDPNSITKTSATVVTLPAQALNTVVVIDIFTPGNGTTQLASTSTGQGASTVGVEDAGGYTAQVNVEGALQDIYSKLTTASGKAFIESLLVMTNYLLKSGGTMTGALAMGNNKITGVAAGTAGSSDAARMADITAAALSATLASTLASQFLALAGGTMSGQINMGSQKIIALAAATAAGEAVRYNEFIAQDGANITTGTVAAARLGVLTGDTGSGGAKGAAPAPAAGDAAANKFLKADGTWSAVPPAGSFIAMVQRSTVHTAASGAWTSITFDSETDPASLITLSGTDITLTAGTYLIHAYAGCEIDSVGTSQLRIRFDGDTPTTFANGLGTTHRTNGDNAGAGILVSRIVTVATGTKVVNIQGIMTYNTAGLMTGVTCTITKMG